MVRDVCTSPWSRRLRCLALGSCCWLVLGVWMIVLPKLSQRPSYQARQQLLDERGIDPSVMFYTELDCLDRALEETRRFR